MKKILTLLSVAAASITLFLSLPFSAQASASNLADSTQTFQTTDEPPSVGESITPEATLTPDITEPVKDAQNLEKLPLSQDTQAIALALPNIIVWDEGQLNFGMYGNPQNRINIRGNVYDPDSGGSIEKLEYRLNGGSWISVPFATSDYSGSPNPRLVRKGDFNIEIDITPLNAGTHDVDIRATDNNNDVYSKPTTTFRLYKNGPWPMPYFTNWSSATHIHQQAQIVDGNWEFYNINGYRGVRPKSGSVGYDRLIAIGDVSWSNYIVTVPVTVRSNFDDGVGGVGIIANWQGHTGDGVLPYNWFDMGVYGYYSYRKGGLAMWLNKDLNPGADNPGLLQFEFNKTYIFKLRAERLSSESGRYSLKVWEKGDPEPAWNSPQFAGVYNVVDNNNDQTSGSILLVAHYVDAVFGDVSVVPLNYSSNLEYQSYLPTIRR